MRPPRRLIDPARLGVSIASLGLRWQRRLAGLDDRRARKGRERCPEPAPPARPPSGRRLGAASGPAAPAPSVAFAAPASAAASAARRRNSSSRSAPPPTARWPEADSCCLHALADPVERMPAGAIAALAGLGLVTIAKARSQVADEKRKGRGESRPPPDHHHIGIASAMINRGMAERLSQPPPDAVALGRMADLLRDRQAEAQSVRVVAHAVPARSSVQYESGGPKPPPGIRAVWSGGPELRLRRVARTGRASGRF